VKQAKRARTFWNIIHLRRAERESAGNRHLGPVRADLEDELGDFLSPGLAARLLGVSHTALSRWIDKDEVPLVVTRSGRKVVPVSALADLYEAIGDERASGRKHALEAVFMERRERAASLQPARLIEGEVRGDDPHRVNELRALAYHRAVARRLRRPMADDALALVRRWREVGSIDPRYADDWERILAGPLPGIRRVLQEDSQLARDLRQNSPFAGQLSEAERRKILSDIR
jgi:hypothetical protein